MAEAGGKRKKAKKRKGEEAPARGRFGGCLARLAGLGTVLVGVAAVLGVGGLGGLAFAYRYYVVDHPGPELDRQHVRAIISQESPVYFRDGTTRVGVFFESEHRQYVPYDDLPPAWVMGIVAAEDGGYWTHPGLNFKGLGRAMRDNLLAGGVVSGGSTLTQQTAKNLFYRPDRSIRAKLVEFLQALRLEAHYDKTEILEFYANQFHVTGNGRGLGIAARHFFDEDPSELGLLECAFLAGLVKGPANYDPFLGDEARREKALTRAHDRTRYVLGRLLDEPVEHLAGPPSDGTVEGDRAYAERVARANEVRAEAKRLLDEGFELPFKHGTFRYESSAVLDEVARRLAEPPFTDVLGDAGIDDPRNAGLVVVTTLDPVAQHEATWALWHHLTEIGTWLEALKPADYVLEGHRGPRFDPDAVPRRHEFRVARVTERPGDAGKKTIVLDLGGHRCLVDRDGVVRLAVASERGRVQSSSEKARSATVDAWVDALPPDAVVLASVREVPAEGDALCDLEVRPELQGAVTAIQDGEVRAMVGGND
ncbi:MAG: transglycosylase domain-containing protein, partial [Myxococcales bacterium]|nr:transglycosylase domain-containing protein [Myxococcales bacterium]